MLGSKVKYNCTKDTQTNCGDKPKNPNTTLIIVICVVDAILAVVIAVAVVFIVRAYRRKKAYAAVCHIEHQKQNSLWPDIHTTREQLAQTDW